MYEGVLKAIREYQKAKNIVLIDCSKQYQTKAWLYIEKGNKISVHDSWIGVCSNCSSDVEYLNVWSIELEEYICKIP